ncbi:Uncharacterized protein Rs2_05680 [Raphanus sativus]|nr:Uncharacterized protein Rs2_05680 [Raphanus sativus]
MAYLKLSIRSPRPEIGEPSTVFFALQSYASLEKRDESSNNTYKRSEVHKQWENSSGGKTDSAIDDKTRSNLINCTRINHRETMTTRPARILVNELMVHHCGSTEKKHNPDTR